jgi:hypothetical protein
MLTLRDEMYMNIGRIVALALAFFMGVGLPREA